MSDNQIVITLDDVLGPDGLEGAWEGMVGKLADSAASKFLHAESGKSFHAACVQAINTAVTERIASRIEKMMNEPIQRTDNWGVKKGEPTTFAALIGEAVDGALTTRVDIYGKPVTAGSGNGKTMLEYALERTAVEGLNKAISDEVKKVNAQAKAAVAKEVANAIAKSLKP